MNDIIKINVPLMLRLLELAKEDVKNDMDLHDIAEILTTISQDRVAEMKDYDTIVKYMKSQGNDELERIKELGGIDQ